MHNLSHALASNTALTSMALHLHVLLGDASLDGTLIPLLCNLASGCVQSEISNVFELCYQ